MPEMTFIDWVVILIIGGAGLAILYKALKEPLDLLGGFIKRLFLSIVDSAQNAGGNVTEIRYD